MPQPDHLMSDIYPAQQKRRVERLRGPQPVPQEPYRPRRRVRRIFLIIGLPLLSVILFYSARIFAVKAIAQHSAEIISERIAEAKRALIAFDIHAAESAFADIKRTVADLKTEASKYGLLQVADIASLAYPPISEAPKALDLISQLSDEVLLIINTSEDLKGTAFSLMVSGQGRKLIDKLITLKQHVAALGAVIEQMKATAASLDYPVGDDAVAFRTQLYKSEQLLGATIDWLSGVHHVAVLFINPSEIRPAGGFPGSYAAVTLDKGNVGTIEVRDIYDPDGQLTSKIIPPAPLQLITNSWGARDANWFFDFPTSARKTLSFLNASKMYSEQGLQFEALLAINVNAVSDILAVTGPIQIPEYKLTLTSENFLDEVQKEVRSGVDRTIGEPKRILKVLTPILFNRIGSLTTSQKQDLISRIQKRFANKDMMAYMSDPIMQAYLEQLGIAGEVSQAANGELNEYLAVVNANIGGGKSDAVISQQITLKSQIDLEGKIHNALTVTRTHLGNSSSPAWYGVTNKDYIQIFTPRGSRIDSAKGLDTAPVIAKEDFHGFETDSDLNAIESSIEPVRTLSLTQTIAFNKTVFAGWLNTAPGTTRTLELQYTNPQALAQRAFADYSFVFEKQSGVETGLNFTITAPPEYKWEESNSPIYTYASKSLPGRLQLDITLIPIR